MLLHFCRKKGISHPPSLYAFLLRSSLAHIRGNSGTWHKNTLHWYRSSWGKSISAFPQRTSLSPPRSKIWRNLQKAGCDGECWHLGGTLEPSLSNTWRDKTSGNSRSPIVVNGTRACHCSPLCVRKISSAAATAKRVSPFTTATLVEPHWEHTVLLFLLQFYLWFQANSKVSAKCELTQATHNSNLSSQKLHLH